MEQELSAVPHVQPEEGWDTCTSGAFGRDEESGQSTAPSPGKPWYLEQNVSISPFMPQFKEQQGGTKSCELTAEQCVLHFCSSKQILNKVQLRLGLQGLIPLWETETQNFCHNSKRKQSDVSTDTCMILYFGKCKGSVNLPRGRVKLGFASFF